MTGLGKTLRSLRAARGWHQSDLARQLGLSVPSYSKLETDITGITFSRLKQIAKLYDLSVVDLLKDRGDDDANNQLSAAKEKLATREKDLSKLKQLMVELGAEVKSLGR